MPATSAGMMAESDPTSSGHALAAADVLNWGTLRGGLGRRHIHAGFPKRPKTAEPAQHSDQADEDEHDRHDQITHSDALLAELLEQPTSPLRCIRCQRRHVKMPSAVERKESDYGQCEPTHRRPQIRGSIFFARMDCRVKPRLSRAS